MKKILFLIVFAVAFSIGLRSQGGDLANGKHCSVLDRISVTTTVGTPTFSTSDIGKLNLKEISQVSISNFNISYKLDSKLSFGISAMSNLSNGTGGYYNQEGQFFPFCMDDDEEEDMEDDDDDSNDDPDDEDCDDDDFGKNLMGTVTFTLSDKLPFFVQVAGGYSLSAKAPAYTALVGYNQKLYAGIGIMAGVRFSDVLYTKPADAVKRTSTAGFKAELGLSWNF